MTWSCHATGRASTVGRIVTITLADRRNRLARRHHLAPGTRAIDAPTAANSVVGLHGSDPVTVYLSLAARVNGIDVAGVDAAMYDDRQLIRLLGMRRTVFTAPYDLARIIQASCAPSLAATERRTLAKAIVDGEMDADGDAWLNRVGDAALTAIDRLGGEALATEITPLVPQFSSKIVLGRGTKYENPLAASSKILFLLAVEGHVVRTRPRGTWTSSLYRWSRPETWLGAPLLGLDLVDAERQLIERWLRTYGPGTMADLRWWTGWTLTRVKRALAGLHTVEVDLEHGGTGVVLADDIDPADLAVPIEPWVALLPSLDPLAMGWTDRDWYVGDHRAPLFDYSGNIGPTVWCDGRIVGAWSQRPSGEVVFQLLEDIGASATAAVGIEAARLQSWIGDARVSPRFPTPLQKHLTSGAVPGTAVANS